MRPLTAALCGLLLAAPFSASAYSSPAQFDLAPSADTIGGGGGVHYTGSERFQGQDCSGCHLGGEGQIDFALSSAPIDLFADGYVPGQIYRIQVDLLSDRVGPAICETDGPLEPCNLNTFALEMLSDGDAAVGVLCPTQFVDGRCISALGAPTVRSGDGRVLFGSGLGFDENGLPAFRNGQTRYAFYWQAPRKDLGALSMWVAAVDGDGGANSPDNPTDLRGDLTGVIRAEICGPSGCPKTTEDCSAAPGAPGKTGAPLGLGLWGLLALAGTLRRRR